MLLNTCMNANMQLATMPTTSFWYHFPWQGLFPDNSPTVGKSPDISRFSRQVVTLSNAYDTRTRKIGQQKSIVWHKIGWLFVGWLSTCMKFCRPTSVESCRLIGWQQVPQQQHVNNVTVVVTVVAITWVDWHVCYKINCFVLTVALSMRHFVVRLP